MGEKEAVFIFDMYQTPNYPMDSEAKRAISMNIPLELHTADKRYLKLLEDKLPACIDKFQPDLIFYNAGTDCLEGDGLVYTCLEFSAVNTNNNQGRPAHNQEGYHTAR